jgi:hypothetical protein
MSESFDRESRAIKDAWRAERAMLAGWPLFRGWFKYRWRLMCIEDAEYAALSWREKAKVNAPAISLLIMCAVCYATGCEG